MAYEYSELVNLPNYSKLGRCRFCMQEVTNYFQDNLPSGANWSECYDYPFAFILEALGADGYFTSEKATFLNNFNDSHYSVQDLFDWNNRLWDKGIYKKGLDAIVKAPKNVRESMLTLIGICLSFNKTSHNFGSPLKFYEATKRTFSL